MRSCVCVCVCARPFLDAFVKLRKVTISFGMSVLSVPPHGTAVLPLDRVSLNLIFEFF